MVMASCNNVLWEVYVGALEQGGAPTGPFPLLKINKSPTAQSLWVLWISVQLNAWKKGAWLPQTEDIYKLCSST